MSAQFLKDKAREISYALARVSWYVKRPELRLRLETVGVELLENAARLSADNNQDNVSKALASVSVLDSLVRLGHSVYEIEPVNATILVRELDGLNTAIRQFGNPSVGSGQELPDLETIFKVKNLDMPELNKEEMNEEAKDAKLENNNSINTAIRQSAIINRVKQGNGNGCKLKDLIAEFPDISERTLRYDLQRLCERGIIERVGNGGPSNYYRTVERTGVTATS